MRRQSPAKITFNYPPGHQPQYQSNYSTRLIQSGFVLGEPVALTDVPHLPSNYHSFSPKASRPRANTELIVTQSRHQDYQAPNPSSFAPPPLKVQTSSISQDDYNRLLFQYKTLQQRYSKLQEKYYQLQAQSRTPLKQQNLYNGEDIRILIERYKENLLDQCKLLVDRARLEQKEQEFMSKSRRR